MPLSHQEHRRPPRLRHLLRTHTASLRGLAQDRDILATQGQKHRLQTRQLHQGHQWSHAQTLIKRPSPIDSMRPAGPPGLPLLPGPALSQDHLTGGQVPRKGGQRLQQEQQHEALAHQEVLLQSPNLPQRSQLLQPLRNPRPTAQIENETGRHCRPFHQIHSC